MGEYAKYHGESVKIGTCEEMYYLRASDVAQVEYPWSAATIEVLSFRLPWRDEADIEDRFNPRDFERGYPVAISDIDNDHGGVTLSSPSGLVAHVRCTAATRKPGSGAHPAGEVVFHRNNGSGGYNVLRLGLRRGRRAFLVQCRDCRAVWAIDQGKTDFDRITEALDIVCEDLDREFEALERIRG